MESLNTTNIGSSLARWVAAAIALLGWIGLIVQFNATYGLTGSLAESLWVLVRYFTVLSNILVAVVMTCLALGFHPFRSINFLGATTFYIATVGILYSLLLRGLLELSGGAKLADFILHDAVPAMAVIYWLVCVPKGSLKASAPWFWLAYPIVYCAYALVRGGFDGKYPYPQVDVTQLGWPQTAINIVMILVGFLVIAYGVVGIDWILGRRSTKS